VTPETKAAGNRIVANALKPRLDEFRN